MFNSDFTFLLHNSGLWYYWVAKNEGKLAFTITPADKIDIDFAVFELPTGISNCDNKKVLRCNATSPTGPSGLNCGYPTGLNLTSIDTSENFNCDFGEDGFCKYLQMKGGHIYALVIMNFSHTLNLITIDWGGDGEFVDSGCGMANVDNIVNHSSFSFFPNPVSENLVILSEAITSNELSEIKIYDVNGIIVKQFHSFDNWNNKIDISNLVSGVYYLEYRIENKLPARRAFVKL